MTGTARNQEQFIQNIKYKLGLWAILLMGLVCCLSQASTLTRPTLIPPPDYAALHPHEVIEKAAEQASDEQQQDKATIKETHIVVVLDESGSMEPNEKEVVQTINQFIQAQQKEQEAGDDCRMTLITFSNSHKTVFFDQPLAQVQPIGSQHYQPAGMTALYDAIGEAFSRFAEATNVLLVVLTDGEENASHHFSQADVKALIAKYRAEKYGWNVLYLSADPTLARQGREMGIDDDIADGSVNRAYSFDSLSSHSFEFSQRAANFRKSGLASYDEDQA